MDLGYIPLLTNLPERHGIHIWIYIYIYASLEKFFRLAYVYIMHFETVGPHLMSKSVVSLYANFERAYLSDYWSPRELRNICWRLNDILSDFVIFGFCWQHKKPEMTKMSFLVHIYENNLHEGSKSSRVGPTRVSGIKIFLVGVH